MNKVDESSENEYVVMTFENQPVSSSVCRIAGISSGLNVSEGFVSPGLRPIIESISASLIFSFPLSSTLSRRICSGDGSNAGTVGSSTNRSVPKRSGKCGQEASSSEA